MSENFLLNKTRINFKALFTKAGINFKAAAEMPAEHHIASSPTPHEPVAALRPAPSPQQKQAVSPKPGFQSAATSTAILVKGHGSLIMGKLEINGSPIWVKWNKSFLRISPPRDRASKTQKQQKPHTPKEKTQAERHHSLS